MGINSIVYLLVWVNEIENKHLTTVYSEIRKCLDENTNINYILWVINKNKIKINKNTTKKIEENIS